MELLDNTTNCRGKAETLNDVSFNEILVGKGEREVLAKLLKKIEANCVKENEESLEIGNSYLCTSLEENLLEFTSSSQLEPYTVALICDSELMQACNFDIDTSDISICSETYSNSQFVSSEKSWLPITYELDYPDTESDLETETPDPEDCAIDPFCDSPENSEATNPKNEITVTPTENLDENPETEISELTEAEECDLLEANCVPTDRELKESYIPPENKPSSKRIIFSSGTRFPQIFPVKN